MLATIFVFLFAALAWCFYELASIKQTSIKRELERHARGREIKRRVLAEVAKQKAVQP